MEKQFNFIIESELPCSKQSKSLGLVNFESLCKFVKNIPYGRTKNRNTLTSILTENKGTCSSKHAFLKQVAIENNQNDIKLFIGIYKMNETNTKGVGNVLKNYNLEYIPEAHTYLKMNAKIIDITRETTSLISFEDTLLFEEQILPNQITDYKVSLHQRFLKQWVIDEGKTEDLKKIWHIRELCIAALSA